MTQRLLIIAIKDITHQNPDGTGNMIRIGQQFGIGFDANRFLVTQ